MHAQIRMWGGEVDLDTILAIRSEWNYEHCSQTPRCLCNSAKLYLHSLAYKQFVDRRTRYNHGSAKEWGRVFRIMRPIVQRATKLLPSILSLLRHKDEELAGLVAEIFDAAYGCALETETPRERLPERKRIAELRAAVRDIQRLLETLDELDTFTLIGIEHLIFDSGLPERTGGVIDRAFPREKLPVFLTTYRNVLEAYIALAEQGEHTFYTPDGPRAGLVSEAHKISRYHLGPEVKTTPGSDFSLFVSLIFEMATGERDASFAGAISRYARSAERADVDTWRTNQDDPDFEPLSTDDWEEKVRRRKSEYARQVRAAMDSLGPESEASGLLRNLRTLRE